MDETKQLKRQSIYFNEHGYNHELKQYGHKKAIEGLILNEFSRIGIKQVDFSNDILYTFYTAIEKIYRESNSLKLSGKKLCDLLEIDDKLIKNHSARYNKFKDIVKPKKYTFTMYAETDKELYKLDYVNRLCDILNEAKDHKMLYRMEVMKVFGSLVKLDGLQYAVNPSFIKN